MVVVRGLPSERCDVVFGHVDTEKEGTRLGG